MRVMRRRRALPRGRVSRFKGLREEHLDGEMVVHALSAPEGGGGVAIDMDVVLLVRERELRGIGLRRGRVAVERAAVGAREAKRAVIEDLDADATFVDETMVKA